MSRRQIAAVTRHGQARRVLADTPGERAPGCRAGARLGRAGASVHAVKHGEVGRRAERRALARGELAERAPYAARVQLARGVGVKIGRPDGAELLEGLARV